MNLLEIPIAATLFLLLFAASVIEYVRRRDPVTGAVVLVFASTAPAFVIRLLDVLFGVSLHVLVEAGALLLSFAQPAFSLRLAALLYPVPRRTVRLAYVGFVVAVMAIVLPVALGWSGLPVVSIVLALGAYVGTAAVSATYFWRAARRRSGSARMRLVIAGGASLVLAGTLLLVGAGAAIPGSSSEVTGAISRYGALLGAVAYALAFVAPRFLRRQWQARTAYQLSQRLLTESVADDATLTWQRLATLLIGAAGVRDAYVLVGDVERGAELVGSPVPQSSTPRWQPEVFATVLARAKEIHQTPVAAAPERVRDTIQGATESCLVTLVPFEAPRSQTGLLILVAENRSLFSHDDHEMFALLASQAAVLADRARAASESAEVAKQLAQTVAALRDASQAKNDFLASMSHELRTPLNAILGFSDLMRGEPIEGNRRSVPVEWIDHVRSAGEHLLALINDVLDLAKVEAGRLDLRMETIDPRSAVADALAELGPLARQKGIALSSNVEATEVTADRARLRQILYNLLSNAIKFTPEDGQVRVEATTQNGAVSIAVIDTGVGIAPGDRERVFEEFTQVGDGAARVNGTGLGLALTRRLVEAHGGTIDLDSSVGQGSRFTVTLPTAALPAARRAPSNKQAARRSDDVVGASRTSLLVIEDDPQAVALLRGYLENDGYELHIARDGVSGIAAARRIRPSAIMLDVLLPGIDGWEVLRRLKADAELADIPVLMVTVVDEREVGLALGASDYLLKPVSRSALLNALRRHLVTPIEPRPARVLVADDDPAALAFVRATLEPNGYEVFEANGGREAVYAASESSFDMIICDLLMPDVDGFEVVAQLKAIERARETPILILTAHTIDEVDKARLNGKIVGICHKGLDAAGQLRSWLPSVVSAGDFAQASQ